MSLIKCPECGKENVSDTAKVCPECGFKINKYINHNKSLEQKQIFKKKSTPIIRVILIIIIAIATLSLIVLSAISISESKRPSERYSVDELLNSYTYLSGGVGKISYSDCKNYFKENDMKYQVEENGNFGSRGLLKVYDDCGGMLKIVTFGELTLVSYGDEARTYAICALNYDGGILYAADEYSGNELLKETRFESTKQQIEWLKNKQQLDRE